MSGFFLHHRKTQDWEWRTSPNHFSIFMYCLERANFKDQKFKGKLVKRGSFLTSHEQISEKTGVKKRSVRSVLNDLKKSGEIVTKSSRQGTEIIVKNWEQYNSHVTKDVTKDVTKAVALKSTIKKEKKEKKENNIYITAQKLFELLPDLDDSARKYGCRMTEKNLLTLSEKYSITAVKHNIEALANYCESTGKIYKSYDAALRNFLKKDKAAQLRASDDEMRKFFNGG